MFRILPCLALFGSPAAAHVAEDMHTHAGGPAWVIALFGIAALGGAVFYRRGR